MEALTAMLRADPTDWLLDPADPAVRHLALRTLLDLPESHPNVVAARRAAMRVDPIRSILAAQQPDGWWEKEGHGYGKYRGTTWSLIFLDQLGADGTDPRIQRACEYVLDHSQSVSGGFSVTGPAGQRPPPSTAVHCLNGNLLAALIGFGLLDDPRVQRSLAWETDAILGSGDFRYYASGTTAPDFACVVNGGLPCAWGAVKALRVLTRVPVAARSPRVEEAILAGAEYLLSRNPAIADYPSVESRTSPSWFKLGFPSGYVADVLQNLESLAEAGYAKDTRLTQTSEWLLARQDADGRWKNQYSYSGKMWIDIDRQGAPSKWVTLRAMAFLRARFDQLPSGKATSAADLPG